MIPSVFSPVSLGPVRLRNRTVKAATFEGRTPDGEVTDALIDYHLAPSRGGIGLTTVAYLAVAPEGRTHAEQIVVGARGPWPGSPGWPRRSTPRVPRLPARSGTPDPVANGRSNGARAISASPMPSPLSLQMIKAATEQDLTRVTRAYVDAARIAGPRRGSTYSSCTWRTAT